MSSSRSNPNWAPPINVRDMSIADFDLHFRKAIASFRHVIKLIEYHGILKYNCEKCDCQTYFSIIPGTENFHFVETQSNMRKRCKRLEIMT